MNNATLELEEENNNPSSEHNDHTFAHNLSEEEMLRIYIGPNADKFLELRKENRKAKKVKKKRSFFALFNITVFFIPLAWLYYRKMYVLGTCFFIPYIAVSITHPDLSNSFFVAFGIIAAIAANHIYLVRAQKHVTDIKETGIPHHEMSQHLKKTGGTSKIGAVIGVFITIICSTTMYVGPDTPKCNNKNVQNMVKTKLNEAISESSKIVHIKPVSYEIGVKRLCQYHIKTNQKNIVIFVKIMLDIEEASIYHVSLLIPTEELQNQ